MYNISMQNLTPILFSAMQVPPWSTSDSPESVTERVTAAAVTSDEEEEEEHGTNQYDFILTTLLVVDEFGEGIPTAWMLSNILEIRYTFQHQAKSEFQDMSCPKLHTQTATEVGNPYSKATP